MIPRALFVLACIAQAFMPLLPVAAAGGPAVPDLSVAPGDIRFSVFGDEVPNASQEYGYLTIGAVIRNAGPGPSAGANVSFFDNGRFLALVPAGCNLTASGPGNETYVEFNWYIGFGYVDVGNHTIRVEARDPLGDSNPADNAAEAKITIHGRRPIISVKLDSASRIAQVTATSPGIVTFTGGFFIDDAEGPVDVTLDSRTENGWPSSIDVRSLVVTDNLDHSFRVTVTIPAATPNSQYGQLHVEGTATADSMSSKAETRAIIAVAPYFCLTALADRTKETAGPGENAIFELTLHNTGNAVDSFSIEVGNGAGLRQKGWSFTLTPTQVSRLNPGATRLLVVQVRPPEDWAPYKDESASIDIRISSLNSKDFGPEIYTLVPLTVEQKGFFMPSVDLIGLIALLAAVASAFAAHFIRRRKKKKTVADYNRELGLD